MKIILGFLFMVSTNVTFAEGLGTLTCLATVTTPPQDPTMNSVVKKIWLKPETPKGEKYYAEIEDLNVNVKAVYFPKISMVTISNSERGSLVSVSISGSVKNNKDKVSLLVSVASSTAVVSCYK
ncbi:MAG: hypothetical protein QE271_08810 [Bacteriovoracaceae bacterium]|nr:hypothetical protein [Bacteriovoracaceae bacterium]